MDMIGVLAAAAVVAPAGEAGGCPLKLLDGFGVSGKHSQGNTTAGVASVGACCELCTTDPGCRAFTDHLPGHHSAETCSLWKEPGAPHASGSGSVENDR